MGTKAASEIRSILDSGDTGQASRDKVRDVLDSASVRDSIATVRSLGGRRTQRALWNLVEDAERILTSDLLAADFEPMRPVVFHGKNSLPAFSEFRKICCRPPAESAKGELWGYNDTSILPLIGPGYFVVHDTETSPLGGTAFDYRAVPTAHPPEWPEIRSNAAGISRFVYHKTVDYMRRVSGNVFIGSATRDEKEMGNYFILSRDLPE